MQFQNMRMLRRIATAVMAASLLMAPATAMAKDGKSRGDNHRGRSHARSVHKPTATHHPRVRVESVFSARNIPGGASTAHHYRASYDSPSVLRSSGVRAQFHHGYHASDFYRTGAVRSHRSGIARHHGWGNGSFDGDIRRHTVGGNSYFIDGDGIIDDNIDRSGIIDDSRVYEGNSLRRHHGLGTSWRPRSSYYYHVRPRSLDDGVIHYESGYGRSHLRNDDDRSPHPLHSPDARIHVPRHGDGDRNRDRPDDRHENDDRNDAQNQNRDRDDGRRIGR